MTKTYDNNADSLSHATLILKDKSHLNVLYGPNVYEMHITDEPTEGSHEVSCYQLSKVAKILAVKNKLNLQTYSHDKQFEQEGATSAVVEVHYQNGDGSVVKELCTYPKFDTIQRKEQLTKSKQHLVLGAGVLLVVGGLLGYFIKK